MTDKPYTSYLVEQPWLPFSEALFDWDEDFHQLMLNDHIRMQCYEKAIKETVNPGDVVVDLGTGTGVLSLWALEAGASRVYGIDMDQDILAVATAKMKEHGFGNRFIPVNQLSYLVELPHKPDVLISEIMGNILDNEDFQPILADAIQRLLKPEGKKIPLSASSYIVPVTAEKAQEAVLSGNVCTMGNHYSLDRMLADKGVTDPCNLYYDTIIPLSSYLSSPQQLRQYSDNWDQLSTYERELRFEMSCAGEFTGFKTYFIAQLSDHTILDISSDDISGRQSSDSWKHAYLPLSKSISVQPGDTIYLLFARFYQRDHNLENESLKQVYRWQGHLVRDGDVISSFYQSMEDTRILANTA
ncbi:MAG: 50S ribosomal protein L11 methyltransferase [Cellvibrionaceae bacterium]